MVRLPSLVSELTLLPALSKLKLPLELEGASPAIKLSKAGIQEGVNGKEICCWLSVVTVSCADVEPTQKSKAKHATFASILYLSDCGLFILALVFFVRISIHYQF